MARLPTKSAAPGNKKASSKKTATPKHVGGWTAAGMKRPPTNYQLFQAKLRKDPAVASEVKADLEKFSSLAGAEWQRLSEAEKESFSAEASKLRADAVPQLLARKAELKAAKRAATIKLPLNWIKVVGAGKKMKDTYVFVPTGDVSFTRPYTAEEAKKHITVKSRARAAAADDE